MSECRDTRGLVKQLRAAGAMAYCPMGSTFQAGWPDRYVAHRLWQGWLEMKKNDRALTTLQAVVIRGLRERGAHAHIVRFVDDFLTVDDGPPMAVPSTPTAALEFLRYLAAIDQ